MVQMDWGLGSVSLAQDLTCAGHQVFKIGLHAADVAFALRGVRTLWFRDPILAFEAWLDELLNEHQIDVILVLNADRTYNRIACKLADAHSIEVFMLELGLVRPLHITAYSTWDYSEGVISQLWQRHLAGEKTVDRPSSAPPQPVRRVSSCDHITRVAMVAFIALAARRFFPHYHDQRIMRLGYQFRSGLEFLRRTWKAFQRAPREETLIGKWEGTYFLVPFQVASDCQIVFRSEFRDPPHFLDVVISSFLRSAPADARLVIKFHPQDRGFLDYGAVVRDAIARLGPDRVAFVDAVSLERAIKLSRGVVTINSTVGLTALRHGCPVKTMGRAIYDQPEITFRGSLDEFWTKGPLSAPDPHRVDEFVTLLESTIQGRGSLVRPFYRGLGRAGTLWPRPFAQSLGLPCWNPDELQPQRSLRSLQYR